MTRFPPVKKQAIDLDAIACFLNGFFAVDRYDQDQNGVYHPSDRPVRRIGLALEPWEGLAARVNADRLDALFLHRPWQLAADALPPDVGVLAYHLAFDERLTLGWNPRLAEVLGMTDLEVLGYKAERAIGMIGNLATVEAEAWSDRLHAVFGGAEQRQGDGQPIRRAAVVGAMNDALVREAAARGAQVYVTGQLRQTAAAALAETGIAAVAIGHRRTELWGLRALAGVLRERWSALDVVVLSQT